METKIEDLTPEETGDWNCPCCGTYHNRFWEDADKFIYDHLDNHTKAQQKP
jgi:hypothetical protein